VTGEKGTFCKISSDGLFDHFSRTFQQRQPTDQTMPMDVPHQLSVVQTTKTHSPKNLHRRRSGHVCTAAATRLQAQTEYAMHNGRKWTKADMTSTRYLAPYIV
jgi:hypothetical protein